MRRIVLISYPRSGSHFIRYCVEYFTKLPTYGNEGPLIIPKRQKLWILYRRHFWDVLSRGEKRLMSKRPEMIFLFRDYHECLLSQMKRSKRGSHIIKHIRRRPQQTNMFKVLENWKDLRHTDIQTKFTPSSLIYNLRKFHAYKGKKMVLYYEDLMEGLSMPLANLFRFIDVDLHENLSEFIDNEAEHRARSYGRYDKLQGSLSSGRPLDYHSSILNTRHKRQMDQYFMKKLGPLYKKYLSRYRV